MLDFCILGNPRSGTTLLRLMLSAHSQVLVPPEAGFAVWLFENWEGKYTNEIYVARLLQTKKIESWNLNEKLIVPYLNNHNVNCLKSAIYYTYKFFAESCGRNATVLGDKNNFYIHHIKTLKELNPNCKYIHIIRDGRDVACSYLELMSKEYTSKYAPKLTTQISEIAAEWVKNNDLIHNSIINERFMLVRLEDLIESTTSTLDKVCSFIGVELETQMLNFHNKSENFEPTEYDQWKLKNKQPIINDNYKYKRILSAEQINEFNTIAKNTINQYQYKM